MIRPFVILSLVMSASAAGAKTSGDAAADASAKPVKEKKICRDSDDSTSRIAKRICRTATEWNEARDSGKKAGVRSGGAED